MTTTTKERFLPPLWLLTVVTALLLVWLLMELREIVVLLVVGYCIAYFINPLVHYLEGKKIRRSVGILLIFAAALMTVSVLVVTALPTLAREYDKLESNLPSYIQISKGKLIPLLDRVTTYLPKGIAGTEPLSDQMPSFSAQDVRGMLSGVLSALLSGYNVVLVLLNLTLLPFIVFYLSLDFNKLHLAVLGMFPRNVRTTLFNIGSEINVYVAAFVRGQLLVGTILFVLYTLGLRVIGIELWFLLGVISGFGNLVPYIGFLVGITLSSLMSLVNYGDLSHLAQVLALYAVVQALEGTFITPKVMGDKVGLSPLMIILAIVAGGQLFGLLGVFLAVPGAAVVRVLSRHVHQWLLDRAATSA